MKQLYFIQFRLLFTINKKSKKIQQIISNQIYILIHIDVLYCNNTKYLIEGIILETGNIINF